MGKQNIQAKEVYYNIDYTIFVLRLFSAIFTYGAKLLSADWLRQRAFFLITRPPLVIKRA